MTYIRAPRLQVNASDSNARLNKLLFAKFSIMTLKTINS